MNRQALLSIAAVAGCAAGLALPAGAGAKIVYTCGPNLCTANDDGSGQTPLTTDGSVEGKVYFSSPTFSADGKKVAFHSQSQSARGAYVLDLATNVRTNLGFSGTATHMAINNNGTRIAVVGLGDDSGHNGPFCYFAPIGGSKVCEPFDYSPAYVFDYAPDGRLVGLIPNPSIPNHVQICRLAPEGGRLGCEQQLVADAGLYSYTLSVSEDGKLAAVTHTDGDVSFGNIALYNLQTGALVKQLTTSGQDGGPTITADSKHVIFTRGSNTDQPALWSIAVDGAAGSEKLIVANARQANAAQPAEIPPAATKFAGASTQKGAKASGSVVVAGDGSKVKVALQSGKSVYGSLSKSNVAAGKFKFTVKLNSKGKKVLADKGQVKVTMVVTVTPASGEPTALKKKVTIKP